MTTDICRLCQYNSNVVLANNKHTNRISVSDESTCVMIWLKSYLLITQSELNSKHVSLLSLIPILLFYYFFSVVIITFFIVRSTTYAIDLSCKNPVLSQYLPYNTDPFHRSSLAYLVVYLALLSCTQRRPLTNWNDIYIVNPLKSVIGVTRVASDQVIKAACRRVAQKRQTMA